MLDGFFTTNRRVVSSIEDFPMATEPNKADDTAEALAYLRNLDQSFYRVDKIDYFDWCTYEDSLVQGYPTMTSYNSTLDSDVEELYEKLWPAIYNGDTAYQQFQNDVNRPEMARVLGIRYLLSYDGASYPWLEEITQCGHIHVYRNKGEASVLTLWNKTVTEDVADAAESVEARAAIVGESLVVPAGSAGAAGAIGTALIAGIAATTWSYDGMQTCVTMGGEIKDPKKNMPIALIGTVLVCTFLYVMLVTAAVGMTDINVLATADAPIATAFEAIMGRTSGTVAALLAVVVVTGSLSSLIMFQARGEMKAAQEGYWWRSWGKIDPRYDSPVVSMLWQSGFALILVWLTTIQDLLGIFTFICLVRNALLFVAWFPLQKKANYKPTFKAPGGAIMALLAIVPSAILAYGELQWNGLLDGSTPLFSWNPISAGILVIASALPFYYYFKKTNADIIEESERKRNELILGK